MAWGARMVTITGLVLLAHSCYSAQEHTALSSAFAKSTQSHQHDTTSLPIDICIETITAIITVCLGLVLESQALHPIEWHTWAGKIEREGDEAFANGTNDADQSFRGSPFDILETRTGFVDIRRQRREFTNWVQSKGN